MGYYNSSQSSKTWRGLNRIKLLHASWVPRIVFFGTIMCAETCTCRGIKLSVPVGFFSYLKFRHVTPTSYTNITNFIKVGHIGSSSNVVHRFFFISRCALGKYDIVALIAKLLFRIECSTKSPRGTKVYSLLLTCSAWSIAFTEQCQCWWSTSIIGPFSPLLAPRRSSVLLLFFYFSFRSRPLIIMIMMSRSIHVENTLSMLLWFSRTDDVNGLLRLKSLVPFGVTVSAACCWSGRFHYFCSNSRSARLHAKGTLRLSHFPFIYQCQLRYSFW